MTGLEGVVITDTRLSRVLGQQGELIIAGFPVDELAPKAAYEEALFLLWHDRLPERDELEQLRSELAARRELRPETIDLLRSAAAQEIPAMDALRLGVDTLAISDPAPTDLSAEANLERAKTIIAQMPAIVATYARFKAGADPVPAHQGLGHAGNYLYMLRGVEPHPGSVRALETYFNTVIDHGMNNSTFTCRVIVSTRSDMVAAVVGAIGALKGPLHGGAPGPALQMVFDLRDKAGQSGESIQTETDRYVRAVVEAGDRVMGFGHRVYKVRDPRADVLGAAAELLFQEAGDTQLYQDSRQVEGVVISVLEELKPGRNLSTNVEFYTALLLHGLELEPDLFSPTFAISRAGGWTAHALEQIKEDRLIRPRVGYSGEAGREWVPLSERG